MDNLTKEQRHKNMKNIWSKDTKIEIILRKALWEKGYRYRKNYKTLPGNPDIVLTKYKIAIFCDGEFSRRAGTQRQPLSSIAADQLRKVLCDLSNRDLLQLRLQ